MPAFVQISSIVYTLLVALAFVFHSFPSHVMPPNIPGMAEVVQYIEEQEVTVLDESELIVTRASWFDADVYEYAGTLLASSYGHDVTLTIEERFELAPLFEEFDRKTSEVIANWTPIPEDWF